MTKLCSKICNAGVSESAAMRSGGSRNYARVPYSYCAQALCRVSLSDPFTCMFSCARRSERLLYMCTLIQADQHDNLTACTRASLIWKSLKLTSSIGGLQFLLQAYLRIPESAEQLIFDKFDKKLLDVLLD